MGKFSIDITIDGKTQTVNFTYDGVPQQPGQAYYVGWASGMTAEFFAGLPDGQLVEMATRHNEVEYTAQFGQSQIVFVLYDPETQPEVYLTSAGVRMQQDLDDDDTCPHDDVTVGGATYKVFGIRMYDPDPTDSITIKF